MPLHSMARSDSILWFILGVAQMLLGQALVDSAAGDASVEFLANLIQISGGGTFALGIYFLIFLARHEDDFAAAYSKAEKTILQVDPDSGKKELVDDSPRAVKAAWYVIPIGMTFLGMVSWLANL